MEDSSNKEFINISNRKFVNKEYMNSEYNGLGWKPKDAFWCSLKSSKPGFLSEYDYQYGMDDNSEGILYATTVKLKKDTAVINPSNCLNLLKSFNVFVDDKNDIGLSDREKRLLFLEFIKDKMNISINVKHLICQIDLIEDVNALEEAFANYVYGKKNSDEVYDNLEYKVRKGLRQCFSGVEVTDFLLGRSPETYEDIEDALECKSNKDPKYKNFFGCWDMHSLALFDTNCVDVIREIEVNKKEHYQKMNEFEDDGNR